MSGHMAPLKQICDLAEKYDSSVLVCDGQATGVVGSSGQGSVEACGVQGRVDILNSTLGKALSGGNGEVSMLHHVDKCNAMQSLWRHCPNSSMR